MLISGETGAQLVVLSEPYCWPIPQTRICLSRSDHDPLPGDLGRPATRTHSGRIMVRTQRAPAEDHNTARSNHRSKSARAPSWSTEMHRHDQVAVITGRHHVTRAIMADKRACMRKKRPVGEVIGEGKL